MDIAVKMMKIAIIVAILFASCTTHKKETFTYNHDEKQLWINSYKYEAFYGCINEGLENDSLRIILKNKDLFNPTLDLDFSTIDQARRLGGQVATKLPKPFVKIDKNDNELADKKFLSFTCLTYYASKELDSAARLEYEKYCNRKPKKK